MRVQEQQYIDRATVLLQQPLELGERIKILKVLSQIYAREAATLEAILVDTEAGMVV